MKALSKLTTNDLVRWIVYAIVVLIPIVYHTGFDAAFTTPKLTLLRVLSLVIVAVWGIQIFAQKKLIIRKSALNKWVLGYGFVLGLTTLFSSYFWVSLWGDQGRFLGLFTMLNLLFLILVILNFFYSKKQILQYIKLSVWTATALSVYGLLQGKGLVGAEGWNLDPTLRIFGTLGHSNHFGAYLAFHLMMLIGLFVNAPRLSAKVIYAVGGVLMFLAILGTASRGAFFALLGALFVFICGFVYYKREVLFVHKKKFVASLILVMILFGALHKPIINKVENLSLTQRTVSTVEFMMQGNVPDRVSWWFSSLAMFRDHPVLGHGLSTFRDNYNLYRRTDYRVPGDVQDTVTPESAHMEYFNILATQGLVGLVVYLGLIFCWFRYMVRILRDPELSRRKKVGTMSLLAAGLVYFVQVLMSFGVVGTLVPLYILLGMSVTYYHIVADPKPQAEQFKTINIKGGERVISAAIVLVLFIFGSLFTYRQAAAEWQFEKAKQLEAQGEIALMIEAYDKAVHKISKCYTYWEQFGLSVFDFAVGSPDLETAEYLLDKSIFAYERAYRLVQTQPYLQNNYGLAYVVYSKVLESKGDYVGAAAAAEKGEELYAESVSLGINNPVYAYNYGELLLELGREDEAKNAFLHILTFREPYKDVYTLLAQIEVDAGNYDDARYYAQKALDQKSNDKNAKAIIERINTETS